MDPRNWNVEELLKDSEVNAYLDRKMTTFTASNAANFKKQVGFFAPFVRADELTNHI